MGAPALEAVLSGAAGPEGVRAALRAPALRRSVRRSVDRLLAPGAELGPVRIDRVKLKPGRKLSVWGRAAVADAGGVRHVVPLAATWVHRRSSSADGAPAPRADDARSRGPLRAWRAVEEATGMELLASPFDPAAPELAGLLAAGAVAGRPRATTVRYRPRQRHVLRFDADRPGADPCWAKLVPGRDGAAVAATTAALADGLAGSGHTVLRPLQLVGPAVLYPHAPGRPLPGLLGGASLERCGDALRRIHDLPPSTLASGREATLEGELAAVARAGEHLADLHPAASEVLAAVLDAVRSALHRPAVDPAPAHGDCKLDHFWVDGDEVTLIDVDSAGLADPARDLGKLLADLRWWAVPDLDAARAAVASGYDARSPDPDRWSRAAVWEGLWLAKAVVRRISLLERDWASRTLGGLQEAAAVLDAAAPVVARA
jgi:hypothetical protein